MRQEIIAILTELRPEFDFTEDVNYVEQGMLDSFDIVSLVDSLDEKYNISISGSDIIPENFSSIEAIMGIIEKTKK